jgi:starch synthase
LRVLHAAAEYQGLAKTGGLADMVAALGNAQHEQQLDLRICLPAYAGTRAQLVESRVISTLHLYGYQIALIEGRLHAQGPLLWLLDCPPLYDRGGDPYRDEHGRDFDDNGLRFGVFGKAVAELALGAADWKPDIVHLHDWHCALAAPWLRQHMRHPRVVFTIHNLAHQGLFDRHLFDRLILPPAWWQIEGVEFHHQLSFMKAGLQFADRITTVSPNYAQEIQTEAYGCQLDGVLRARSRLLHGIVNGIDERVWNPATDALLAQRYDVHSATAGKLANKRALQRRLQLPESDAPLLIFIGRLADQKGADLLLAARDAISRMPLQFVLLGSGDKALEQAFSVWAQASPAQVRAIIKVDEAIAHQLTAAADLQIMPSRFEPCGLNQMYAQRYGTIPLVRRTGGLADTVTDTWAMTLKNRSATGVHFDHADVGGVLYGINRGLELWRDEDTRAALCANGMQRDFSWHRSAQQYLLLYRDALTSHDPEP